MALKTLKENILHRITNIYYNNKTISESVLASACYVFAHKERRNAVVNMYNLGQVSFNNKPFCFLFVDSF